MNIDRKCRNCGTVHPVMFLLVNWICPTCNVSNNEDTGSRDYTDWDRKIQAGVIAEKTAINASRRKPYKRFGKRK